jgi:hypothetical protein
MNPLYCGRASILRATLSLVKPRDRSGKTIELIEGSSKTETLRQYEDLNREVESFSISDWFLQKSVTGRG